MVLRKEKKSRQISAATREKTLQSLDEFDRRLDYLIVTNAEKSNNATDKLDLIKTIQKVPGGDSPTLMYVDQNALKQGFESSQKKMKEHTEDGLHRQKMHDRRRRKFLREYDTMQSKLSHSFFEEDLVTQLLNTCKDEVLEEENYRKVVDYKKVIVDNRANRLSLIDAMRESFQGRMAAWDRVEASREIQWVVEPMLQSQRMRREALQSSTAVAHRQQSIEVVVEVIDKIFELSFWTISCRLVGVYDYKLPLDGELVTPSPHKTASHPHHPHHPHWFQQELDETVLSRFIFKDVVNIFESALPIADALPIPEAINVSSALVPFSISQRLYSLYIALK